MGHSTIKGKQTDIKLWLKPEEAESQALDQLKRIAALPWVAHVCAMADCHLGKGATVGSVIGMREAVSAAAVGVDIGCTDADTEYLSPSGWRKISEYNGGLVMQYDPKTGAGSFVEPSGFVDLPCEWFYHFKTKYGVDQMLSPEHRILYAAYDRSYKFDKLRVETAEEIAKKHNELKLGFRGRFLTSFTSEVKTSLPYSDEQLRLLVAVAADGSFSSSREHSTRCVFKFKKDRKVSRALMLLGAAEIPVDRISESGDGVTTITFRSPERFKSLSGLWEASYHQLRVIVDEVFHWDGNTEDKCFYTRDKGSADFIHYALTATGSRAVLRKDNHYRDGKVYYRVFANPNTKVGISGTPKTPVEKVPSPDGRKYCFKLPSGFWVMRRNGNIAVTGNCGMTAVETNLRAENLPEDLSDLRSKIEGAIPVGFRGHDEPVFSNSSLDPVVVKNATWVMEGFNRLRGPVKDLEGRAAKQLGTLGGGNHFIEVCLDELNFVWLMLHSGSRNIGKTLADYHISVAKKLKHNQALEDKDLAVFLSGTEEMAAYKEDLRWAQTYAAFNRGVMMSLVKNVIKDSFPQVEFGKDISCHHNYVNVERHFGEQLFVTRKGAISAKRGQFGIIPGSMGAGSYIVRGLGNPDSLHSASHGAGRRMSRSKAKKTFTLDDLQAQTQGVECRKDSGVIDEIPGAYKDIDEVMKNQQDLVEVVAKLKQIVCVKG